MHVWIPVCTHCMYVKSHPRAFLMLLINKLSESYLGSCRVSRITKTISHYVLVSNWLW